MRGIERGAIEDRIMFPVSLSWNVDEPIFGLYGVCPQIRIDFFWRLKAENEKR